MSGGDYRVQLIRWFLARSDVDAAVRLLAQAPVDKPCPGEWNYIKKYWPNYFDPQAYAKVYQEAGVIEARNKDAFQLIPQLDRYKMISFVMSNLGDCKTVLDFGCSRGMWDIHLHNEFGKRWMLYDIDQTSIDEARTYVKSFARDASAFEFNVTLGDFPQLPFGSVDCVLLLEVLEHVQDPMVLLQAAEDAVRPGGAIILSVPSGPMEYTMWVDHPKRRREHLREFEFQDLIDVLGKRTALYIQHLTYGLEKYTGLPIGHFVVAWRKEGPLLPLGRIDWGRKLAMRPVPMVRLPGE